MLAEERDKYAELRRATSQSVAELAAQAELLENETEIQRNAAVNKDRWEKERAGGEKKKSCLCQRYNNSRPAAVKYCSSTRSNARPPRFFIASSSVSNFFLSLTFERNRPRVPDLFQLLQVAQKGPHEDLRQLGNRGEAAQRHLQGALRKTAEKAFRSISFMISFI